MILHSPVLVMPMALLMELYLVEQRLTSLQMIKQLNLKPFHLMEEHLTFHR